MMMSGVAIEGRIRAAFLGGDVDRQLSGEACSAGVRMTHGADSLSTYLRQTDYTFLQVRLITVFVLVYDFYGMV